VCCSKGREKKKGGAGRDRNAGLGSAGVRHTGRTATFWISARERRFLPRQREQRDTANRGGRQRRRQSHLTLPGGKKKVETRRQSCAMMRKARRTASTWCTEPFNINCLSTREKAGIKRKKARHPQTRVKREWGGALGND